LVEGAGGLVLGVDYDESGADAEAVLQTPVEGVEQEDFTEPHPAVSEADGEPCQESGGKGRIAGESSRYVFREFLKRDASCRESVKTRDRDPVRSDKDIGSRHSFDGVLAGLLL